MTIRVVVADDFPLIRRAIAEALIARPGIDVVGEAGDGLEAVRLAHEKRPDVLLLDLGMPGLSGLETLSRLRDELPDLRVLIVTASEKPENLLQAFNAGAAGYLTKRSSVEELFDAI